MTEDSSLGKKSLVSPNFPAVPGVVVGLFLAVLFPVPWPGVRAAFFPVKRYSVPSLQTGVIRQKSLAMGKESCGTGRMASQTECTKRRRL
jgi:hypothetical protein